MSITTVLDPPLRSDGPTGYPAKAETWMTDIVDWTTEVNATAALVNAYYLSALASAQAAQAATNYAGLWVDLTGAYSAGTRTYHLGEFWILSTDTSDVTLIVPGTDSEWLSLIYPVSRLFPSVDSTTAITITDSTDTSDIVVVDTTNDRVGINKTPAKSLDINGTIGVSDDVTVTKASGTLTFAYTSAGTMVASEINTGGTTFYTKDLAAGADLKFFRITSASGARIYQSLTDAGSYKATFIKMDSATGFTRFGSTTAPAVMVDVTGKVRASTGVLFGSDTAAANTLDDYEEGTYTATLTCTTSGTITLDGSYNTLSYTKIGELVTITGFIKVTSVSSPVGTLVLNLPISAVAAASGWIGGECVYNAVTALGGTNVTLDNVTAGANAVHIHEMTNVGFTTMAENMAANSELIVNFSYKAA